MKKVIITLGLTLLMALAYYGSAHADTPTGIAARQAADKNAKKNGVIMKRRVKAQTDSPSTDSSTGTPSTPKVLSGQGQTGSSDHNANSGSDSGSNSKSGSSSTSASATQPPNTGNGEKDAQGHAVVMKYDSKIASNGKTINVTIAEDGDKIYTTAQIAGERCDVCTAQGEKSKAELSDRTKSFDQQAQDFAKLVAELKFGKLADQAKSAVDESKLTKKQKKQINNCEISKDTLKGFRTMDDKLSCLSARVDELFDENHGTPEDIAEARRLLTMMSDQAQQDLINGVTDSPFVQYFNDIASGGRPSRGGDISEIAKFNFAMATKAYAAKALYFNQYQKIQDMEQAAQSERDRAANYRTFAMKTQDMSARTRLLSDATELMADANQQSQLAAQLKQGLPQLKANATSDMNKYMSTPTANGFSKNQIKSQFAGLNSDGRNFYDSNLLLTPSFSATGNSAVDSIEEANSKAFDTDYNSNLRRFSREFNDVSCRDGLATGCSGSPAWAPSAPPSLRTNQASTTNTALPPPATIGNSFTNPGFTNSQFANPRANQQNRRG